MDRCLPATTSSTCLCQSAPCMWQVHVVQQSNVAFGVDAHTLFDEARRENDAVHQRGAHHGAWVALDVLVDAHIGIEICRSWRWSMSSRHPNRTVLARPCNSSGRTSRRRTPRASDPKVSNAVCFGSRARPRAAARHGKSSILPSGFQQSVSVHGRA